MILKSKKGMSLVEVMIVAALMGVLALVFSQMMNFQMQGQGAVNALNDMNSLATVGKIALANMPTCNANVLQYTATYNATPATLSTQHLAIPQLTYSDGTPIVSTVAPNNVWGNSLTITSIAINPTKPIDALNPLTGDLANITITGNKKLGTVIGSNVFTTNIPISLAATIVSGTSVKISGCSAPAAGGFFNWGAATCPTGYNPVIKGTMLQSGSNQPGPAGTYGNMLCGEGPTLANYGLRTWNGSSFAGASQGVFTLPCAFCAPPSFGGCVTVWGKSGAVCPTGFNPVMPGIMQSGGAFNAWSTGETVCASRPFPIAQIGFPVISSQAWNSPLTQPPPPCEICCTNPP